MAAAPDDRLPPGTEAAFAKMRESFRARLPERWAEIVQARDGLACQAALHRLAGAAGSFGFPALSAVAREAEAAVPGLDAGQRHRMLSALAAAMRGAAPAAAWDP